MPALGSESRVVGPSLSIHTRRQETNSTDFDSVLLLRRRVVTPSDRIVRDCDSWPARLTRIRSLRHRNALGTNVNACDTNACVSTVLRQDPTEKREELIFCDSRKISPRILDALDAVYRSLFCNIPRRCS